MQSFTVTPTDKELLRLWASHHVHGPHYVVVQHDKEPELTSRTKFLLKALAHRRVPYDVAELSKSNYMIIPFRSKRNAKKFYKLVTGPRFLFDAFVIEALEEFKNETAKSHKQTIDNNKKTSQAGDQEDIPVEQLESEDQEHCDGEIPSFTNIIKSLDR